MSLPTYQTGTVSVSNGATTVVGVGAIWSGTNVKEGDFFVRSDGFAVVTAVTDTTHLEITPWPGANVSGGAYTIHQNFSGRVVGVAAAESVSDLIAVLDGMGTIYAVSGDLPDPSIGDDGQYALKTNTGLWKLWLKVGGVWVDQGSPVGTNYRGTWTAVDLYAGNDVVTRNGSSYIGKTSNTNRAPESNPSDWDLLAAKGSDGTNGATWTSGSAVPSGGADGDYYFRTTTSDVYRKVAGTWSIIANIKGEMGNTGPTGLAGSAATIAVNSTTTLPAGGSATVTNLGTSSAASFAFAIPQGATGIQGLQGIQGDGLNYDASGTFAQRGAHDGETTGYSFLETDVSPFRLYVKASNTSADWAGPTYIGGNFPVGDMGHITDSIIQTYDFGHIA